MGSTNIDRRNTGGRVIKLAAAIVLLAVAAILLGRHLLSDDRQAMADPAAKIKLACTKCNYEFEMLFNEYQKQAPKGAQLAGGLTCPKCGAKSVQRVATPMPMKPGPLDASSGAASEEAAARSRPPARRTE